MRAHTFLKPITVCFLSIFAISSFSATITYVKHDASGSGDGSSWTNAYTTMQPAIEAATSSDQVWVAAGTYKPISWPNGGSVDREKHFSLRNGVAVYGGFSGNESSLDQRNIKVNETILSGEIGLATTMLDNSYHVFFHPQGTGLDNTAVLDGFTITGGNANGSIPYLNAHGGGMDNRASSPTVTNCIFSDNSALAGGGMNNDTNSTPTLSNCTFSGNSADDGGGIRNAYSSPTMTNCTFSGNSSSSGSGMHNRCSSPTVTDCTFSSNSAERQVGSGYGDGGGMFNMELSYPVVENCLFTNNSAERYGGGVFNSPMYGSSSAKMTNCIFSGNSADTYGGGMYSSLSSPTMINCVFADNSKGGGIYNTNNSTTIIINSTIVGNSGGVYNDDSLSQITNCVLWGNDGGGIIDSNGGLANATYSLIQGGYTGVGNLSAAPLFLNAANPVGPDEKWGTDDDGLRLLDVSSCINTGDNSAIPAGITTDLTGNPRIQDGTVDMGAYEGGVPTYSVSGTISGDISAGVTVSLSGNTSKNTTTDPDGTYILTELPDDSYTVTPTLTGYTFSPTSIDTTISGAASTGNDFTATIITYSISGTVSGDVQEGVTITLSGGGTETTTSAADGTYSFTELNNGSYTVTPNLTGYAFSPTSIDITISGADLTGSDFSSVKTSTMSMAVSPENGGSIDPTVGDHTVNQGQAVSITATAATGYVFVNWTAKDKTKTGNATITDPSSASTTVTLTGNATVTANFATTAQLTMAVSPNNTGTTSPAIGIHTVKQEKTVSITATATEGYAFVGWSGSENVTIADPTSTSSTAILSGDGTVTANFVVISTGMIIVTFPNGGEEWSIGSSQTITWASSGVTGNVQIELYKNSTYSSVIASDTDNDGSYEWTIPATISAGTDYKVKVSSIANSGIYDLSNADFTVSSTAPETATLGMAVLPTNAGTTDPAVGTHTVNKNEAKNITATAAEGYTFVSWKIVGDGDIADSSSASTTVTLAGEAIVTAHFSSGSSGLLVLTSPNGGEEWAVGSTQKITWVSVNVSGNVKLDIYKNDVLDSTITPGISVAAGTYAWIVPATQTSGSDYRIKVTSASDISVSDESDADFSIISDITVTLTMAVSPTDSGTTVPSVGTTTVSAGDSVEISATATGAYEFIKWKITANATVVDDSSADTTATLLGDATITALFTVDGGIVEMGKVKITLDDSKENRDKISIIKAELPDSVTFDDIDSSDFSYTLGIDDYTLTFDNNNGELRQKGKKEAYTYQGNAVENDGRTVKAKLDISLETGKRYWSVRTNKLNTDTGIDSFDGVDIFLNMGANLFGDNLDMDEKITWKFKDGETKELSISGTPISSYTISKANGKSINYGDGGKDTFGVSNATIEKDLSAVPGTDDVIISIDEWEELTDSNNWRQSGDKSKYKYNGTTIDDAKMRIDLDFEKGIWKFKLNKASLYDYIYGNDGIDVRLTIGDYEGGLRIYADQKTTLTYPQK